MEKYIPQEPIDLVDFQSDDDVEQELRRREYEDLDLLFAELKIEEVLGNEYIINNIIAYKEI